MVYAYIWAKIELQSDFKLLIYYEWKDFKRLNEILPKNTDGKTEFIGIGSSSYRSNALEVMMTMGKSRVIKILIFLSIFYVSLQYILYLFIVINIGNISYEIFRIYIEPTTLILGLAAVVILIHTLKKKIIKEKYLWIIFFYIVFGILAVLGYCGMMLEIILRV